MEFMLTASVLSGTCNTPAAFQVEAGIDFVLPHTLITPGSITDLPRGFAHALASRHICPRYIYLSYVVPSYDFVLQTAEPLPLFKGMRPVAGLWMG